MANLITFLPGETARSADINSNFAALNNQVSTPVSVTGQTSGSATLYQIVQTASDGKSYITTVIHFVNYKNTANQYLTLPTPYADRAAVRIYETQGGHVAFYTGGSGGSAVNVKVMTGLASGGGSQNTQNYSAYWSEGQIDAAWDTIQLQVNSGAANGLIIIEGF